MKNKIFAIATFLMIFIGILLIGLGWFLGKDNIKIKWISTAIGVGFFALAWVFNALKGRL
ncbi:MAG: hypothetical protein KGV44_02370 [Flavobacteriaceae bacterium]|nr:hypothetical protein [Flavobacteriaceae bacterium]